MRSYTFPERTLCEAGRGCCQLMEDPENHSPHRGPAAAGGPCTGCESSIFTKLWREGQLGAPNPHTEEALAPQNTAKSLPPLHTAAPTALAGACLLGFHQAGLVLGE